MGGPLGAPSEPCDRSLIAGHGKWPVLPKADDRHQATNFAAKCRGLYLVQRLVVLTTRAIETGGQFFMQPQPKGAVALVFGQGERG